MKNLYIQVKQPIKKEDSIITSNLLLSTTLVTTFTDSKNPDCLYTESSDVPVFEEGVYMILNGDDKYATKEVSVVDVCSYGDDYWVCIDEIKIGNGFYIV